jgi:hypothetical protein
MSERLRRAFRVRDLQLRQSEDGKPIVEGYAAVFDSDSVELGWGFIEQIAKGAFRETLGQNPDVALTFNHDANFAIARTINGTLTLREDEVGLRFEAELDPEDPDVQKIVPKIRSGLVRQMSFAFWMLAWRWIEDREPPLRIIEKVDLDGGDVSIVVFPAYPATEVLVRARAFVEAIAGGRAAEVFPELRDGKALTPASRELVARAVEALGALLAPPTPPATPGFTRGRQLVAAREKAGFAAVTGPP